jgi:hypothetical protein
LHFWSSYGSQLELVSNSLAVFNAIWSTITFLLT